MILRDYQEQGRDAVIRAWEESQCTLLVWPTGLGKTILFASVIEAMQPGRFMVVAHREELIWQARDKIHRVTGLDVEIEMADLRATEHGLFERAPVIVATVQTLNTVTGMGKRLYKFRPEDFTGLIIDEAHHSTAETYRFIIQYFCRNPKLRVLGVTATPDRTDEQALGQIFKTVADDYEIKDAIDNGWLVDIDQQFVRIKDLDFSTVRTTAGDLNGGELARVMENERNLHGVVSSSLEIIGERRAIGFTVSVNQAEQYCNIFNRHRPGKAAWVCGETAREERRETLRRFAAGEIQMVWNCGVLTEGFDDPGVEVIIMARPTKSRSLYCQMVGRSTRPVPGLVDGICSPVDRVLAILNSRKPSCLVVDFVGNSGKHKLIYCADILGGKMDDRVVEKALRQSMETEGPVKVSKALEQAQAGLLKARAAEEARRANLTAKADYSRRYVNPFSVLDITPVKDRGWDRGRTLSGKQRALLLRQGINPDDMPYAQARQIINTLFERWRGNLASVKQVQILKKYSWIIGPGKLDWSRTTRDQASEYIDRIALRMNWKQRETKTPKPTDNVPF